MGQTMADPAFLIVASGLGLSGIVSAAKFIAWFLEGNPKSIAQAGQWGAASLFALSFPLLLGLVVNQRWSEAIGLSALLLMAFALYGPRTLGQFVPRRRLAPDESWPSGRAADWKTADAGPSEAEMVQRSIAVLEDYLSRTTGALGQDGPDFRTNNSQMPNGRRQGDASGTRRELTSSLMSESEALEILGLRPDAEPAEINEAHRRLMQLIHPDRGGSQYFAVKANQAKDVLLNCIRQQLDSSVSAKPRKRRRRDRGQIYRSPDQRREGEHVEGEQETNREG
jgi:hypothetical protein